MPSVEASLANLELAKLHWRPPRPWRSPQESYVIRRMIWQWHVCPVRLIYPGRKWSARRVARRLGVRHRYVQKLIREFTSDPPKMWKECRESGFQIATFEQLRVAREQTRWMAERGLLRPLRRSMWGDRKIIWSPLRIPPEIPMWATPGYSMMCATW